MTMLGIPAQTDREKQALETIKTMMNSIEAAHRMIEQLTKTIITMNDRIMTLEEARAKSRPRLIIPNSAEVGHG
jgi:translation initiation factor 2B subunit (eIF-2B alpha/beta/delta family)